MLSERYSDFLQELKEEVIRFYGDNLVTLAIFGSVARGTMRLDSDIDLFICASNLPDGRWHRVDDFEVLESRLEPAFAALRQQGITPVLSPIIKTPAETELGSVLFIDMTEDVIILFDKESYFRKYLDRLTAKMKALGSKKVMLGNAWYWILIPDHTKVREVSL